MRTTVRIDDDLLRALKERSRREEVPLSRLLNDALRRGLAAAPPARRTKRFVQRTTNMGKPLIDLTKAMALAAALEDEETLRKMGLGKSTDALSES